MTPARANQFDLFGREDPSNEVTAAVPDAEVVSMAARLPASVRFGTSSWSFPGWAGLVYARTESPTRLARHGLSAYARHPLFRTVSLDRTFYAPIEEPEYAEYAAAVPDDFRFLVKAHAAVTTPGGGAYAVRRGTSYEGGRGTGTTDVFLDAAYTTDAVIAPAVQGLGARLGALLFQFSPLPFSPKQMAAFPDMLGGFLSALPRGVPYAVEVRDAAVLGAAYASALRQGGATHCYTVHPRMPDVLEQAAAFGAEEPDAGPVAVRWVLRPDQEYEVARRAWAPFNALMAPDPACRTRIATLTSRLAANGRQVLVTANNKAEGSAPRTITELARLLAHTGAG